MKHIIDTDELEKLFRYSNPLTGKKLVAEDDLRALIANSPQADDVPPDVYDIVVDTGDGIYHTAEVVHFQQSGSKRMIQVRFGDTQADDVRKDAERYRWLRHGDNDELVIRQGNVDKNYHWLPRLQHLDEEIDKHMASEAIDKAME